MKQLATRALWTMVPAVLLASAAMAQSTAINTTGAVAAPSALLDISSTNRGLLIPRMTEAQRLAIPVGAPEDGLWVYQITNAGNTTPNGLWYYDASAPDAGWYRMSAGTGWLLAGNTLTNPATNFLGTTDAQPLVIATNDVERMRLHGTTGFLGIANNNPVEALSVTGGINLGNGAAPGSLTTTPGVIRYNTTPTLPAPFPAMNPQIAYHEGVANYTLGVVSTNTPERLQNAFLEVNDGTYLGSVMQCGNGTAETPNTGGVSNVGTPSFADTPFPTSAGRGSKYQYVFTAAELTAMGLCPGNITELAFRPVTDDINMGGPPNAASIQLQIRMMNAVGPVNFAGGFNQALSASPLLNAPPNNVAGETFLVSSGLMQVAIVPFNWTGGDLMIDLSYSRAAFAGNSPGVQVNTGFANCTFRGYIGTATFGWLLHATVPPTAPPAGWTSLNFPVNPQATCNLGPSNERPVTRFTGQAQVPVPTPLLADYVQYGGGLLVGTAAWASTPGTFRGPGVIRAEVAAYDGTVALSDHVFDRYYDGAAKPGEGHLGEALVPLDNLKDHLAEKRHLPSLPSRYDWETTGAKSLGQLSTGLWEAVEHQALYIIELNTDLKALENEAFGGAMGPEDLQKRVATIQDSPRLTATEKERLIAALRKHNQNTQH